MLCHKCSSEKLLELGMLFDSNRLLLVTPTCGVDIPLKAAMKSVAVYLLLDRPCYQMFSVAHGEAVVAEILQYKLFENAAALKVGQ